MKKGTHSKKWFIDNLYKELINVQTRNTFIIQSVKHAEQMYLNQKLNNIKYEKTERNKKKS